MPSDLDYVSQRFQELYAIIKDLEKKLQVKQKEIYDLSWELKKKNEKILDQEQRISCLKLGLKE